MGDAYWRYGNVRPQAVPTLVGKRPRSEFDIPGGHELPSYFSRDNERGAHHVMRETSSIGASYDRFLRTSQIPPYIASESGGRPITGGITGAPVNDARAMGIGGVDPGVGLKGRSLAFGGGRTEIPLPSDATNTLFVEGLPANCTRREVAHIFRPFVGYKEVRLVSKESRHKGGDPLVLCFVDFVSPAHAATALDALQGYKFDEQDRDSVNLRLQFARYPGARSGGGHRGKR